MGLTWEECGGYVPVMERNHNPTAQDEMMRMLDECARLGKENTADTKQSRYCRRAGTAGRSPRTSRFRNGR